MRGVLFLAPLWLVACGSSVGINDGNDDTGNGNGNEDPGATFTMRVDGVRLAEESDGFDLDEHSTTSASDPIGCGKVDGSGGIDNELAGLEGTMSTFGFDLDAAFADAISGGELVIDMTITGYHGADDDSVLLDVTSNGDVVATDVAGTVSGGVLSANVPELPLSGEIDGQTFTVTARDVELALALDGAPEAVSVDSGLLGGGLIWDEAGEADLRALVLANVPTYLAGMAEGMAEDALDLLPPSASSGDCDAISTALLVDASAL